MRRMITIGLEEFKSIRKTEISLHPINVLIGENASGKSNFLSAFAMLNHLMTRGFQRWVQKAGGPESILHGGVHSARSAWCWVDFEQAQSGTEANVHGYSVEMTFVPEDTLAISEHLEFVPAGGGRIKVCLPPGPTRESVLAQESIDFGGLDEKTTHRTLRFLLSRCRYFHLHDTSAESYMRRSCAVNDVDGLKHNAGNLAAFLYRLSQADYRPYYDRVVKTIRRVYYEFDDFVLRPTELDPDQILLRCRDRSTGYVLGPHQLSDGSLRFMALATLFLQPEATLPDLIALDEPELGLHPGALNILAGMIRGYAAERQVIVATQSMGFVDAFKPEDVIVTGRANGCTTLRRLDPTALTEWMEDYRLGELVDRGIAGLDPTSPGR